MSEPRRCPWRQLEGWENRSLLAGRGLVCRRRRHELAQCCAPVPYASPAPPSCQSTPSRCAVYQGPAPSVHAAIAGPDMQRRGWPLAVPAVIAMKMTPVLHRVDGPASRLCRAAIPGAGSCAGKGLAGGGGGNSYGGSDETLIDCSEDKGTEE